MGNNGSGGQPFFPGRKPRLLLLLLNLQVLPFFIIGWKGCKGGGKYEDVDTVDEKYKKDRVFLCPKDETTK